MFMGCNFMKIIKRIFSIIGVIICILSSLLITLSIVLKWNLDEQTIVNTIQKNDMTFILKNESGEENSLLYQTREALEVIGIPSVTIEEVLNSNETKKFISKYVSKSINSLLYDNEISSLSKEDLLSLARGNYPVIEQILKEKGETFTEKQQRKIEEYIIKYSDTVLDFFPTAKDIQEKLNKEDQIIYHNITLKQAINLINYFTSNSFLLINFGVLLFGLLLIIVFNWRSKTIYRYLYAICISNTFILIILEIFLGTIFKTEFMEKLEVAQTLINYVVNTVSKTIWLGIFPMIILSIIFSRSYQKKQRQECLKCEDTCKITLEK